MKIEIDIPRPGLALALVAACTFAFLWARDTGMLASVLLAEEPAATQAQPAVISAPVHADFAADLLRGSPKETPDSSRVPDMGSDALIIHRPLYEAEEELRQARSLQEVLSHKEEFIRYQLQLLQQLREEEGGSIEPELEEQYRQSVLALTALLKDQRKAEQFVLSSLTQIWQAQGRPDPSVPGRAIAFRGFSYWPVSPAGGISAGFHDPDYRAVFPQLPDHDAIDIPVLQGTTIRAPAGGKVIEVQDQNGLGFNFLRIEHQDGVVTLYGHVTESLVREGEYVQAGDPIAKSGGMPGTAGAGAFTTGAHLHFRLDLDGVPVDPTEYLPEGL